MRNLKTPDFFKFSKIIRKMGLREDLKKVARDVADIKPEDKAKVLNEMQIELLMIFVENIGNAENEIYEFISNVSEKPVKELKDMDFDEFMGILKEIFLSDEIKSFFITALK